MASSSSGRESLTATVAGGRGGASSWWRWGGRQRALGGGADVGEGEDGGGEVHAVVNRQAHHELAKTVCARESLRLRSAREKRQ